MKRLFVSVFAVIAIFAAKEVFAAAAKYEGWKKCGGCHKSQKDSWLETKHAKTLEVLKPNAKADAKNKAKLDPAKDYTQEKDCLACHTTGFQQNGGYKAGISETEGKYVGMVGCEVCHGAGSEFRKEHSKAGDQFKKSQKSTPREVLVKAGQNFEYEEVCAKCHMNYEGSPWKGAKEPYTPFTPKVDAKYKFDFSKAVKNTKAMHEHFKLKGAFEGEPVPAIRAEFQKSAKEAGAGEEEK